jgi:hypothetical protein
MRGEQGFFPATFPAGIADWFRPDAIGHFGGDWKVGSSLASAQSV